MPTTKEFSHAYRRAHEAYAAYGVYTESAIAKALDIPISLHCWQADDVRGLKTPRNGLASGGIIATDGYPGCARNGDEMRADLDLVLKFLPGKQRVNLHASDAETNGSRVDRDQLEPKHFSRWLAWAEARRIGLDFNPTYFAHPKAVSGFTLSHADPAIRKFWIAHGKASRRIAQHFAERLGTPCVNNHWVPDGTKEAPTDRWAPRARLVESFDAIFADKSVKRMLCVDAVEGQLLDLDSEDYVVGSQEFCSSYAQRRGLVHCLDLGHDDHPTKSVTDKVSALMQFHPRLLLHTSCPVRWDSDHVVKLDDPVRALFLEIARGKVWERVFVALDLFDASIDRIAAYVTGALATRQAILRSLLDPSARLRAAEDAGRGHERLALIEQAEALPWDAVWNELCERAGVPVGTAWLAEVALCEEAVLAKRC
jgi:L-rhamnose isomerase